MSKICTSGELTRQELEVGNLYYIEEKLKRKQIFSDSIVVWTYGPLLDDLSGEKDKLVDTIWMNPHCPFVLFEIKEDPEIPSTFWYKILTKRGCLGWFALDDEDMQLLHLCFKTAIIPKDY